MNRTLYIFDFDNTIVNTAQTIVEHGYDYDFSLLKPYENMSYIIRNRLERNRDIIVLTARRRCWVKCVRQKISELFSDEISVHFVPKHFLKWFLINILALRFQRVIVIDDMFRREETGLPKRLKYPSLSLKNVIYITHERVIRLRGLNTLKFRND